MTLSAILIILLKQFDLRASTWFYILFMGILACFLCKMPIREIMLYARTNKKYVIIISLITTFAIVGNKLIVYPIGEYRIKNILFLFLFCLLFFVYTAAIMSYNENIDLPRKDQKRLMAVYSRRRLFVLFCCLF